MPDKQDKLQALRDLLETVDNSVTREEFVKSFEAATSLIIKSMQQLTDKVDQKVEDAIAKMVGEFDGLKGATDTEFTDRRNGLESTLKGLFKEHQASLDFLRDKVRSLKNGPKGDKGDKGDKGRDGSPDTGDQIIEKINGAKGLIVKDAIDGLKDLIEKVDKLHKTSGGGGKGFTLYVNGVKKLLTAQTINVTGSGVSYNYANGRNDITITHGSGSFGILAATGDIDNSNTSFTFLSEPVVVVVNGATYRDGAGCTISGTSVTLDNPIGIGGDIYGLG